MTQPASTSSDKSSRHASSEEIVKQKQDEIQKKLMDEGESTLQQQENYITIKGQNARHLVMQRLMRPQESKVVILKNMVGPEDVDEMLQEEIQEECTKYGVVERVLIYKEKQTDNDDEEYGDGDVVVKIFVEFSMSSGNLSNYSYQMTQNDFLLLPLEAEKAKSALNGRFFGGRLVQANSYDQALFDHNDFTG